MKIKDVTPIEVIDAAIERLQTRGWIQRQPGRPEGPNCLEGALWYAQADLQSTVGLVSDEQRDYYLQVRNTVGAHITGNHIVNERLIYWNDTPGRTVEDVLLVLKETRHALEETDAS